MELESVLKEKRLFKPSKAFQKQANISSEKQLEKLRIQAKKNPEKFWATQAKELHWFKPWKKVLKWNVPYAQWFVGGQLNISYNCLDRHLSTSKKNKAAIIWESEDGVVETYTYSQLHQEVNTCAAILKSLGVKKGDVVGIYMGMTPYAAIAMLACARIGATHNVVFGGFSPEALKDRLNDSKAVLLITQDYVRRRGEWMSLKDAADKAVEQSPTVKNVLVYSRSKKSGSTPAQPIKLSTGRDHLWHVLAEEHFNAEVPAEALNSEHPHFILYTSGSTGKPKGILHTTGGYLTQAHYTTKLVFDLKEEDIYFCTADVGWITGHSYVVYGLLSNGATVFMYEGVPNYPGPDRLWQLIDKHKATIFYTAPTAIRSFMRWGDEHPKKYKLSSLRLLGTVGEPINPEAWMWYQKHIGRGKCPIVDTWWQTETGAIMVAPVPGAIATKPGSATKPLPGLDVDVVHKDGTSCKANEGGLLVVKRPWPSMLRTVFGNDERYVKTYWSDFAPSKKCPGFYFTGDGARKDKDAYFWIMGRVDDVVNVSGHRLGTAEVESALVSHASVAEAAVVARPDDIKGQALVAFVTLKSQHKESNLETHKETLRSWVAKEIGPIAKPDEIRFAEALPKTRSGKIMRRLLRELVTKGSTSGDVTTLEDFSVLEKLRQDEE